MRSPEHVHAAAEILAAKLKTTTIMTQNEIRTWWTRDLGREDISTLGEACTILIKNAMAIPCAPGGVKSLKPTELIYKHVASPSTAADPSPAPPSDAGKAAGPGAEQHSRPIPEKRNVTSLPSETGQAASEGGVGEWITLAEAAKLTGRIKDSIAVAAARGKIKSELRPLAPGDVGNRWGYNRVVERSSLLAYYANAPVRKPRTPRLVQTAQEIAQVMLQPLVPPEPPKATPEGLASAVVSSLSRMAPVMAEAPRPNTKAIILGARTPNQPTPEEQKPIWKRTDSEAITIKLTPQLRRLLDKVHGTGLYGLSLQGTARTILSQALRQWARQHAQYELTRARTVTLRK